MSLLSQIPPDEPGIAWPCRHSPDGYSRTCYRCWLIERVRKIADEGRKP